MTNLSVCKACGAKGVTGSYIACRCPKPASTIGRERKQLSYETKPVVRFDIPPIEPCVHLGQRVGVANCGCAGKSDVYWCNLQQGHVTQRATGKAWFKIETESGSVERQEKLLPCLHCANRDTSRVVLRQPKILCELPSPKSNRAVVTVAPDFETQAELAITGPLMKRYAESVNADYIVIDQLTEQSHKCGNKYAYAEVAARYEQSLWLDTDVVMMDGSPDIFQQVRSDQWGLCDDLPGLKQIPGNYDWFNFQWRQQSSSLGLPAYDVPKAWNSGVVVAPTDAARWYHAPEKPVANVWCAEQHYHTRCLLDDNADVVDLDRRWNVGFWDPSFVEFLPTGCFIHLGDASRVI